MLPWKRLGEILQDEFKIPAQRIEEALARQPESGRRLGELLLGMKVLTQELLPRALASQQGCPYIETIPPEPPGVEVLDLVPINFAK
jgi:general secretion pathway protein E